MSSSRSSEPNTGAHGSERDLLAEFTGRHRGFQAYGHSSYRTHEAWRNDVLRALQELERQGLLVIRQLVPCVRHGKCQGQPIAAGCELTREGQLVREFVTATSELHPTTA